MIQIYTLTFGFEAFLVSLCSTTLYSDQPDLFREVKRFSVDKYRASRRKPKSFFVDEHMEGVYN